METHCFAEGNYFYRITGIINHELQQLQLNPMKMSKNKLCCSAAMQSKVETRIWSPGKGEVSSTRLGTF